MLLTQRNQVQSGWGEIMLYRGMRRRINGNVYVASMHARTLKLAIMAAAFLSIWRPDAVNVL